MINSRSVFFPDRVLKTSNCLNGEPAFQHQNAQAIPFPGAYANFQRFVVHVFSSNVLPGCENSKRNVVFSKP